MFIQHCNKRGRRGGPAQAGTQPTERGKCHREWFFFGLHGRKRAHGSKTSVLQVELTRLLEKLPFAFCCSSSSQTVCDASDFLRWCAVVQFYPIYVSSDNCQHFQRPHKCPFTARRSDFVATYWRVQLSLFRERKINISVFSWNR